MPLIVPKQGATQEEINAWIIDTQKTYDTMEIDLQKKTDREQELLKENNKLYVQITTKKSVKEVDNDSEEIPFCLDKTTYEKLSEKDIEELNELIEEEND